MELVVEEDLELLYSMDPKDEEEEEEAEDLSESDAPEGFWV